MVATVGRITAGRGYDYLTKSVATSDHDYYTGSGEAAGVWSGRGSAVLGLAGEVDAGDMAALYGRFVVPSTAGGKRFPSGRIMHEVILGRKVSDRTRADGKKSDALAALDVTFSPSKSVSVLWALTTDAAVRQAVVAAHDDAVATALEYLDAHAGHTRGGAGGVRRIAGNGFVVAQFRHRTARSTDPRRCVGDPQLHTHCAILNRIQGVDGKWRALDSKAIYRHAHAAGAVYAAELERLLTDRLGVAWEAPAERVPMREIAGIPAELRSKFSTRTRAVVERLDEMVDDFRAKHGRSPTRPERERMHDQATVKTRHTKGGSRDDLHARWRAECTSSELAAVNSTVGRAAANPERVDGGRLPAASDRLAEAVFDRLHERQAWWTRANIAREVADLIDPPTLTAIEAETERIAGLCVEIEPDDDSEYANRDAAKLTSATILDAEARVLAAAEATTDVRVKPRAASRLGPDQAAAVRALCAGDRQVQTVVGPAGAGKTTMLRAAAASWEAAGRRAVVLALSAAAARVVTDETGLPAHTVASWRVGQVELPRGGIVIVDEASMVPTLSLDQLVSAATDSGSRVALLGDPAQMGSPEAGGLLRDLAARPNAVELVTVRRFANEWERTASKRLHNHDASVTADYLARGRIIGTLADGAAREVAEAWLADVDAGLDSLIVVDTAATAAELSGHCQHLLGLADRLGGRVADACADGNPLHIGDIIQTRRNTNDLATTDGKRVLNRDVWRISGRTATGELTARSLTRRAAVTLTANYVEQDVVLAYATTIAGAQGRTTDTGHVLVTPATPSNSLYVGMTRGKQRNTAHVVTDGHDHDEFALGTRTPADAFAAAVWRDGAQRSAHSVRAEWQAETPARRAARLRDQHHRAVVAWWGQAHGQLPPRIQRALDGHDDEIVAALERCYGGPSRLRTLRLALRASDWSRPGAADRFVHTLRAVVPRRTVDGGSRYEEFDRVVGEER